METTKEITLYYHSKNFLEKKAKELDQYNSKSALESRYNHAFASLRNNRFKINFEPADGEVTDIDNNYARKLVNLCIISSGGKLKMDWARINALIDSDYRNVMAILDHMIPPKAIPMLEKLVRLHCMPMSQAWRELGNRSELKQERNYYSFYYGNDLPKQWKEASSTKGLDQLVSFLYGPEKTEHSNPYRAQSVYYLVPKSELIIWYFTRKYGMTDNLKPVVEIEKDLKIYQGSDFISQLPIFDGMKTAGQIEMGATKVPMSVAKKIASLMTLKAIPRIEYAIDDRFSILANLGAYISVGDKKSSEQSATLEDKAGMYLKAMFGIISITDDKSAKYIMSNSIPKLSKRILDVLIYKMDCLADVVKHILTQMPADKDMNGEWVRYDNVVDWIEYEEASGENNPNWLGYGYSYIELPDDKYLYYPDYYSRLKMPVIDGILQMLASIGLIDYAYENIDHIKQEIRYIRISNAGLWIVNRVPSLKIEIQAIDDGLHFDPETLMITIKDINSPNYALLEDLTEKISPNRYRITESALLRGCKTYAELTSRVDRLKNYLLNGEGDESVRLKMLLAVLSDKYNKVRPAQDVDYYFMDVDPKDKELHDLLLNTPQIRKNTLRVEGWKLLVKKSFYPTFLERLRQAGYLIES